ncbi:MAG: hypothetical protein ACLF0G_16175 [Candidatus Brocadiia bacterium]
MTSPRWLLVALLLAPPAALARTNWEPRVRAMCDFLLRQQDAHGCLPSTPDSIRVDGDVTHVLFALAQGYRETGSDRFRRGLRDGLLWLASRMDTSRGRWRGSWRYAYSAKPPYVALATSPCRGVEDGRGYTATSAFFVYLVALYTHSTGDAALARSLRPHARCALDFLLERNLAPNHLFYRGWHLKAGQREWTVDKMQFATDQAAAYLGLRAGGFLLGHARYDRAADRLAREVPRLLFDERREAFAPALDPRGKQMPLDEGWTGYFAQGLLAWAFGSRDETREAVQWLRQRHAPDHSVRARKADPPYILSAAALCIGCAGTHLYPTHRRQAARWLRDYALTPEGGVRHVLAPKSPIRNDHAAWVIAAWLGTEPLPFRP